MAGIGFSLRQLTRRDDLLGMAQAFGHAAVTTTGPWLATVLAIGTISLLGQGRAAFGALETFRLIVIYNFAFSLLIAGPFMLVATRQLADLIFARRIEDGSRVLLGHMTAVLALGTVFVGALYVGYARFAPAIVVNAAINFFLVAGIWMVSVMLTTLKAYNRVTLSFAIGLLLGTVGALALAEPLGTVGLLIGLNAGLTVTLFSLLGQVYGEYPSAPADLRVVGQGLRRFWLLALSGFVYNFAMWVDKFVMWLFAPQRLSHASGLVIFPEYDSALFSAYLTIVPGLCMFLVIVETSFFERYHRFYQDILNHSGLARIKANQAAVAGILTTGLRNLIVIQGALAAFFLLGAAQIYDFLGLNYSQLIIFRYAVLAAFGQCLLMFVLVVLAYFDLRRLVLGLQTLFAVANGVFTYASIQLGQIYYGLGTLAATALTFLVAYLALVNFVRDLPFQAFVKQNTSIT